MVSFTWLVQITQGLLVLCTFVGLVWTFYRGTLPSIIEGMLPLDSLQQSVADVEEAVSHIEDRIGELDEKIDTNADERRREHADVMRDIRALQVSQIDIGRAINQGDEVNLEALQDRHFGDDPRPGDLIPNGGDENNS